MKLTLNKTLIYFAFLQSIIATLGSLYFSEVMKLVPCTLCWYQRICMYPLVAILGVGIWERKKDIYKYVLPLSVVGLFITLYHNLLQYGYVGETSYMCTSAISCMEKYAVLGKFVTIPLLSLTAFTVITTCMVVCKIKEKK